MCFIPMKPAGIILNVIVGRVMRKPIGHMPFTISNVIAPVLRGTPLEWPQQWSAGRLSV